MKVLAVRVGDGVGVGVSYFYILFFLLVVKQFNCEEIPRITKYFSIPDVISEKLNSNLIKNISLIRNITIIACKLENCKKCEGEHVNKSSNENKTENFNNLNENNQKCKECSQGFLIFDYRCYDSNKLNEFVNELKVFSPPKQRAVMDFVMKSEKNKLEDKFNNENRNEPNEDLNYRFKNLDVSDLRNIKEDLKNLKIKNERKFRIEINDFMINFEQNMQTIMSLANLFEQTTVYEIEKQKNSIIELINSENLDPNAKLSLANNKLNSLKRLISEAFDKLKSKVQGYEHLSNQKIERAKNSFLLKNNKFLN